MCLVDVATGRLDLEQVDLRLGGPIPLELFRYYRSTHLRRGDLGFGWSHPFCARLWPEGAEALGFLGSDGRRQRLPRPEVGGVHKLPGEGVELEHLQPADGELAQLSLRREQTVFVVRRSARPTLVFAADGLLPWLAIVHASGVLTRIDTDRRGLAVGLTDPAGRRIAIERRDDGLLTGLAIRQGDEAPVPLARYAYDAADDLIAVRTAAGTQRFEYDDAHRLVAHWNEAGNVCRSRYDADGRCVETHGAEATRLRRYHYHPAGRRTEVEDGRGARWVFDFDDAERVVATTDPLGHRSTFDYDANGRLLAATDAAGFSTAMLVDAAGQPAGKLDPAGAAWLVKVTNDGVEMTSPEGARAGYGLLPDGRIASLRLNGRAPWQFRYGADGRVSAAEGPDGRIETRQYSADGRRRTDGDAGGPLAVRAFDLLDREVREVLADGRETRIAYGPTGFVGRIDRPDGSARRFEHDPRGRILRLVDEAGHETRWLYDAAGRRIGCDAANGDAWRVAFDGDDRLTEIRMPGGREHRFAYDARGKLVAQRFADGREERYAWDPRGLPLAIGDAGGIRVRAAYDAAARPTGYDWADGLKKRLRHDADGRWIETRLDVPAGLAGPGFATVRRCRRTPAGDPVAEWQDELTLQRTFDDAGRCVAIEDGLGQRTGYAFDKGRVVGTTTATRQHRFEYDRFGRLVRWDCGNGTVEIRRYDDRDRMIEQRIEHGGRLVVGRRYGYDALGRLTRLDDSGAGESRYGYDAIGRLAAAAGPAGAERFDRTPAGGVLLPDARYDGDHRIVAARGWTLVYDARGYVVERHGPGRSERLAWSDSGLLLALTSASGETVALRYDIGGRLVAWNGAGDSRRFLWDGDKLRAWFVPGRDAVAAPGQAAWITWVDGRDAPIEQSDGRSSWSVHTDHNGRVRELISADGRIAWRDRAGVWGERRPDADTGSDAIECLMGFPGQWRHPASGLLYNRHRWYCAEAAHYLSPDPIGLWGGMDAYAYADDPVNRNDPLGLNCRGKTDDPALYRADRRPPEQICKEGFKPWNPQGTTSLADHVNGSNSQSPWVSTTYNRQFAHDAKDYGDRHDADIDKNYPGRAGPWIYEIDNPGCGVEVDCDPGVIAHAAQYGQSASEQEIAFKKTIPPGNIVGAYNLDTGEMVTC